MQEERVAFGRIASLFTTRNQILRDEGALSFAFRDAANSSNKIFSTMRNRDVIAFAFLVDSKRHREVAIHMFILQNHAMSLFPVIVHSQV